MKKWDDLPKWARVIPYVAISGALTAVLEHLTTVEVNEVLTMGIINLAIVGLKELLVYIKTKK